MTNQSIYSNLVFAQNAITNALEHETVKTALAEFGYDSTRLKEGLDLYEKAARLQDKQRNEYGEQLGATLALTNARMEANKLYMLHLKIARIALRNDRNAAVSLQLEGDRNRSFTGWLEQARVFYANALGDEKIVAALATFNITKEKLEEARSAVNAVELGYNTQMQQKGEAQAATKERDEAFDALQAWMSDYRAIARLALDGQSQYLEVLGIVEPS
jgi:hypothetical protein